jgi:hypothetical protein
MGLKIIFFFMLISNLIIFKFLLFINLIIFLLL